MKELKLRITAMVHRYEPNQLARVDALLEKHQGKEEELLRRMVAKYGPEPSSQADPTFRPRVERMFKTYAPENLGKMDALLQKYPGREAELMEALVRKYGPEPPAESNS